MQSMQTKPNIPNPLSPCIILLLHSFSHWSTSNFGAWLLKNEKGTTMSCFNIKVVAICALTNDDSETTKTRYNSTRFKCCGRNRSTNFPRCLYLAFAPSSYKVAHFNLQDFCFMWSIEGDQIPLSRWYEWCTGGGTHICYLWSHISGN